jgi:hypothetical protein
VASSGHKSANSLVIFFSIREIFRPFSCTLSCIVFEEGDLSDILDLGDLKETLLGELQFGFRCFLFELSASSVYVSKNT